MSFACYIENLFFSNKLKENSHVYIRMRLGHCQFIKHVYISSLRTNSSLHVYRSYVSLFS